MASHLHPKPQVRLDRALFKARPRESLLIIAYALSLYLLPLALFVWVATTASTLWTLVCLPLVVLAGYGLFLQAILGHEGFHFNLSANPMRSCYLGIATSSLLPGFCVTGYFVDHWQHHRYSNSTKDPDYQLFSRYHTLASRITLSRLIATLRYLQTTWRLAFGPLGNPSALPLSSVQVQRLARCNIACQVVWLSLYGLAIWLIDGLLLGFSLSLAVAFMLSAVNAYQEHAFDAGPHLPPARSRTSRLNTWLHAGSNFHLEHHFYPAVPCWRLPKVHRQLLDAGWYEDRQFLLEKHFVRSFRYATGRHPYRTNTVNDTHP
ncbi:stearoyl-CoA 9-desaturase [Pseudomonas synxantha BG33R]|uniref:fatty acid desaturase family protein n=1 Tax=Pseudomonas TaxID=286 RepID=UPI00025FE56E|nr:MULTISPECIES: fatty acid desaturase [Pseudomonas]EIK72043.1 stearoyl-CoA 9-desaturase [Pseudomonas synxantha BG33R]QOY69219.1 fatty acid desaturase [Pseudomonas sp. OST1909]